MRLLLINPNSSVHITERMAASARAALGAGDTLNAVTATGEPAVVRSAALLALADANAVALAGAHAPGHDALLLAISLDGAAPRLRAEHPGLAVLGMTEAAVADALAAGGPFGLLTLGEALVPLYRARVESIGAAAALVAIEAPELGAAFLPAANGLDAGGVDAAVLAGLLPAARRLVDAGAHSVVLAGAVLCGYDAVLASALGVPVFDGVACAVRQLRGRVDSA
jgi:allantoin racemase